jgi:ABC-type uncharacterized transport system substrate-binding protein
MGGLPDEYVIGADYVIEYRQRPNLDQATFAGPADRVIFCMSTTVVHAASKLAPGIPTVGIVSDPAEEQLENVANICGISGQRFQKAGDCITYFHQAVPTLRTLHVLHKDGYRPSQHAHDNAREVADALGLYWDVHHITSTADIVAALKTLPLRKRADPATVGIFVLPVDVNFAAAPQIIEAQNEKNNPAWFPTPDWVSQGAFGGHGAGQGTCGNYMADAVAYIWEHNNAIPNPAWALVNDDDFDWFVSRDAANNLNIPVNNVPADNIT